MKCDKLKAEPMVINDDYMALYYPKESVDAAIDELKTENESLLQQNRELCLALQVTFSKEEYDKQKAENAELKQKLEDAQATAYAESVDEGMRERRLCRALYKACANWADVMAFEETEGIGYDNSVAERWRKMESKCLKKVEEYK